MAKDLKVTVNDLIANKENSLNKTGELHHSRNRFVNLKTLELEKGLDPRKSAKVFEFDQM
jgi:hypothetical protein